MNRKIQELNTYWESYVQSGLVCRRLDPSYFSKPDSERYNYICLTGNYQEDQATLKKVLTKIGRRKLNSRFKAWKYKRSSEKVSVTLNKATLSKLKTVQRQAGLNMDKYDLMFEFWFAGDFYDRQMIEKAKLSVADIPPTLKPESMLFLLLHKLPLAQRDILKDVLESAFSAGWDARQQMKRDSQKGKAIDEYREKLDDIMINLNLS